MSEGVLQFEKEGSTPPDLLYVPFAPKEVSNVSPTPLRTIRQHVMNEYSRKKRSKNHRGPNAIPKDPEPNRLGGQVGRFRITNIKSAKPRLIVIAAGIVPQILGAAMQDF